MSEMITIATAEVRDGIVVSASSASFKALMERLITEYGAAELFRRTNTTPAPKGGGR